MSDVMTVWVRDRSSEAAWGSGPTRPVVREVTIPVSCPQCGGRRGEPWGTLRDLGFADTEMPVERDAAGAVAWL